MRVGLVSRYEVKDCFITGNEVEKEERVGNWIDANIENRKLPKVRVALEVLHDAELKKNPFKDLDNFGSVGFRRVSILPTSHLYDTEVKIGYSSSLDEFSVACAYKNFKIWNEFCVRGHYRTYDSMSLLEHALHNADPDMMKSICKDGNENEINVSELAAFYNEIMDYRTAGNVGVDRPIKNEVLRNNTAIIEAMTENWNSFLSVVQTDKEGNRLNPIKVDGVGLTDKKVIGTHLQEMAKNASTDVTCGLVNFTTSQSMVCERCSRRGRSSSTTDS